MNTTLIESRVEPVDFRSFYPESQRDSLSPINTPFEETQPSEEDVANLRRFCNEVEGLVNGDLYGYSVFRQFDGSSTLGEDLRDVAIETISGYLGTDVEGVLTDFEFEHNTDQKLSPIQLSDADVDNLKLDDRYRDAKVEAIYREIRLGSIAAKSVISLQEFEFPAERVVEVDGEKVLRSSSMRIINVIRHRVAEPETQTEQ